MSDRSSFILRSRTYNTLGVDRPPFYTSPRYESRTTRSTIPSFTPVSRIYSMPSTEKINYTSYREAPKPLIRQKSFHDIQFLRESSPISYVDPPKNPSLQRLKESAFRRSESGAGSRSSSLIRSASSSNLVMGNHRTSGYSSVVPERPPSSLASHDSSQSPTMQKRDMLMGTIGNQGSRSTPPRTLPPRSSRASGYSSSGYTSSGYSSSRPVYPSSSSRTIYTSSPEYHRIRIRDRPILSSISETMKSRRDSLSQNVTINGYIDAQNVHSSQKSSSPNALEPNNNNINSIVDENDRPTISRYRTIKFRENHIGLPAACRRASITWDLPSPLQMSPRSTVSSRSGVSSSVSEEQEPVPSPMGSRTSSLTHKLVDRVNDATSVAAVTAPLKILENIEKDEVEPTRAQSSSSKHEVIQEISSKQFPEKTCLHDDHHHQATDRDSCTQEQITTNDHGISGITPHQPVLTDKTDSKSDVTIKFCEISQKIDSSSLSQVASPPMPVADCDKKVVVKTKKKKVTKTSKISSPDASSPPSTPGTSDANSVNGLQTITKTPTLKNTFVADNSTGNKCVDDVMAISKTTSDEPTLCLPHPATSPPSELKEGVKDEKMTKGKVEETRGVNGGMKERKGEEVILRSNDSSVLEKKSETLKKVVVLKSDSPSPGMTTTTSPSSSSSAAVPETSKNKNQESLAKKSSIAASPSDVRKNVEEDVGKEGIVEDSKNKKADMSSSPRVASLKSGNERNLNVINIVKVVSPTPSTLCTSSPDPSDPTKTNLTLVQKPLDPKLKLQPTPPASAVTSALVLLATTDMPTVNRNNMINDPKKTPQPSPDLKVKSQIDQTKSPGQDVPLTPPVIKPVTTKTPTTDHQKTPQKVIVITSVVTPEQKKGLPLLSDAVSPQKNAAKILCTKNEERKECREAVSCSHPASTLSSATSSLDKKEGEDKKDLRVSFMESDKKVNEKSSSSLLVPASGLMEETTNSISNSSIQSLSSPPSASFQKSLSPPVGCTPLKSTSSTSSVPSPKPLNSSSSKPTSPVTETPVAESKPILAESSKSIETTGKVQEINDEKGPKTQTAAVSKKISTKKLEDLKDLNVISKSSVFNSITSSSSLPPSPLHKTFGKVIFPPTLEDLKRNKPKRGSSSTAPVSPASSTVSPSSLSPTSPSLTSGNNRQTAPTTGDKFFPKVLPVEKTTGKIPSSSTSSSSIVKEKVTSSSGILSSVTPTQDKKGEIASGSSAAATVTSSGGITSKLQSQILPETPKDLSKRETLSSDVICLEKSERKTSSSTTFFGKSNDEVKKSKVTDENDNLITGHEGKKESSDTLINVHKTQILPQKMILTQTTSSVSSDDKIPSKTQTKATPTTPPHMPSPVVPILTSSPSVGIKPIRENDTEMAKVPLKSDAPSAPPEPNKLSGKKSQAITPKTKPPVVASPTGAVLKKQKSSDILFQKLFALIEPKIDPLNKKDAPQLPSNKIMTSQVTQSAPTKEVEEKKGGVESKPDEEKTQVPDKSVSQVESELDSTASRNSSSSGVGTEVKVKKVKEVKKKKTSPEKSPSPLNSSSVIPKAPALIDTTTHLKSVEEKSDGANPVVGETSHTDRLPQVPALEPDKLKSSVDKASSPASKPEMKKDMNGNSEIKMNGDVKSLIEEKTLENKSIIETKKDVIQIKRDLDKTPKDPKKQKRIRFRKYCLEDFTLLNVLGRGSFGKVFLAELKNHEAYFAIKCMKKHSVIEDDDVESTMIERRVLALGCVHPFICKLFCTFQTDSYLCFVMEYLSGGDLMFHVQKSGRMNEDRARFYAAEVVCALKFLHKRSIIYRDLKLDNIVLDSDGHIRLVDFGMCQCKIYREDCLPSNFCGTPEYMAPEIIQGVKYNHLVDWWSFGVLMYEMLVGKCPFTGSDEDELLWNVCYEKVSYPKFMTTESKNLIVLLLEKTPEKRLGSNLCPVGDIIHQPFFSCTNWDLVEKKRVRPPYRPDVANPRDISNFDSEFTQASPQLTPIDAALNQKVDHELFKGFSYTNPNMTD